MSGSTGRILVSLRAVNRAEVLAEYCDGKLLRSEAAEALGLRERQVTRLAERYRKKGVLGLDHKLLGKRSNNRTPDEVREHIQKLLTGKYSGFNTKHAHERLIEDERIHNCPAYSTLARIVKELNLGKVKKRRASNPRKRRQRFSAAGFMLQMDGSTHRWLGDQKFCLIAGIDDASSDVPYGQFFKTESLEGYIRVLTRTIELRGVPRVVYVDRASWLGGISDGEKSQFQRMCKEIGIRVIHASSPQAKGRVERLWGTLQDRLVSEFRLEKLTTLNEATDYLNTRFLPDTWSKKFTVIPESGVSMYRPCPREQDLKEIFCLKLMRKIRKDHTLLFENEVYSIEAKLPHSLAGRQAELRIYPDGRLKGFWGGRDLVLKRVRSPAWVRSSEPKTEPALAYWKRMVGEEFQIHSVS